MTVGIPGWVIAGNAFGMPITYTEFIRHSLGCDDLRVLFPFSPVYADLDLLILPGGADVNPARYNEIPSFYTDKPDIIKEYFDVSVLPRYIANKTPIFGICRGLQTLAVHFGCTLNQDMDHETNPSEDPYKGIHNITIKGSNQKVKVNSRHHQSVYIHSMNDTPVQVLAVHTSLSHHVEAIRVEGQNIAAVQYHPEDLSESAGVRYALELIKSIQKK